MPEGNHAPSRRVLLFGGYDSTRVSRIPAMAEGLRANSLIVDECNEPLEFPHDARVRLVRHPWLVISLFAALARCWLRLLRRSRHLPGPDAVLVPYPAQLDVLMARFRFPHATLIADLMVFLGDTVQDRRGLSLVARGSAVLDWLACRTADLILLDTEQHRSLVAPSQRHKCVVVPVGAPGAWFQGRPAWHDTGRDTPLRIMFFGMFTPLQGTLAIADALRILERRGVPFTATIVGTGQDSAEFDRRIGSLPSVRRIDWLDDEGLRQETCRHDVCLGIFGTTPKALRVVPQKIALGAATGAALVTSDTPPQRTALQEAALYAPAGDAAALAGQLERLARDPSLLTEMRRRGLEIATEKFSPPAIVKPLVDRLRSAR